MELTGLADIGETITGLSDAELDMLLTYWQKALRLQDWRIRVTRSRDLDAYAKIAADTSLGKVAVIKIRQPILPEAREKTPVCIDEEVAITHELLHLHSRSFDHHVQDDLKDDTEFVKNSKVRGNSGLECMIELTAQALVSVRRGAVVPVI